MRTRSYSELCQIADYDGRLTYLRLLDNNVNSPRDFSGDFFRSPIWKQIRNSVIQRDARFDLGIFGIYINGPVYVHHINPVSKEDVINLTDKLTSLDNLISTSLTTHNAIHYKQEKEIYVERTPGDTKFW